MNRIVSIKVLNDYNIWLQYQDGETRTIDFKPLIGKGVSAPLLDKDYFSKVTLDNGGGLEWPNGMDFCPNYLREYSENLSAA